MDERLLNQYASEKQLKENNRNNYIDNNFSSFSANNYNPNLLNNINSNASNVNFPSYYNNNNNLNFNLDNNNYTNKIQNKDYLIIQDSTNKDSLLNQNSKAFNDLNISNQNFNNSMLSNDNQINNTLHQQTQQENNYNNNNNNNLYGEFQSHRNINNLNKTSLSEETNLYNTEKLQKYPRIASKSNKNLSNFKFKSLQKQKLKSSLSLKNDYVVKSNYLTTYEKTRNANLNHISLYRKKSKTKLFLLDNIIENLSFTKNHLAIILICVLNMILDGYLNFIISKISILTFKYYQWNKNHNINFHLGQQFFLALGALISTNTRSIHWDVRSNTLVSLIGAISLFLIHFYTDAVSFCVLIYIYSVCHGFISNICTNYLLEIVNVKYRSFFYSFAFSFKIFGMFTGVWFVYGFSEKNLIDFPSIYTIGLPVGEFFLSFLLFFKIDSLRMLFYSDEIGILFDLLQDMDFINEFIAVRYFDVDLHKKNFVVKLDDKLFDVNLDLLEKGTDLNEYISKQNENNEMISQDNSFFVQNPNRMSNYERDFDEEDPEEDCRSNYNYVQVPGRKTTKLNIDRNELRTKILEAKSSPNILLSPEKIQNKNFNIPIYEDDNAHLYFNPILTDDFIFKKAILKKFEEIKKRIERLYGVQENHGVFNSFYILLTKKYYVNTLTSIFFIIFSNLIFINVHYIYPELDFYKSKNKVDKRINDPNYIELNINNLNNKELVFYFLALFISFNFLCFIQHIILSCAMNYNSIFAYNSVKNLEKHLDEKDKKFLESEENESEENVNLGIDNENQQLAEGRDFFTMEEWIKKIQKTIKEKLKKEITFAAKLKRIIHLLCLITVLICLGCFVILKHQNIYVLFVFDLFMLYYCCLIYFHFSEQSTTLLRNCTTSIMYMSICFTTIAQNFVKFDISYMNMLIFCFLLGMLLAILDWILIDHTVSFKGLQKIEFSIMKKNKK